MADDLFIGGSVGIQPAAAGGLVRSDDFNSYGDTDPWPTTGNWSLNYSSAQYARIVSGQVGGHIGGGNSYIYWNADTFNANQYSQMKWYAAYSGPCCRLNTDAANITGYVCYYDGANLVVTKYIGATPTEVFNTATTVNAGDTIRMEINGTGAGALVMKVNGTPVGSPVAGDASVASGQPGVMVGGENARIDDWEGGDL